jgi:hypothetical protein
MAIVDTATLRASTSCPTSRRLLDARGNLIEFHSDFLEGGHGWSCSLENNTPLGAKLKSSRPGRAVIAPGRTNPK